MSIYRVHKDKENPYVMVNKGFINDPELSWKAKGILLYMLSKPDGWQFYETEIENHSSDGLASVRSGVKELLQSGYMTRSRKRDEKGKLTTYEYDVFENKQPTCDFPMLDNHTLVINDSINNEKNKRVHHSMNDVPSEYIHLPMDDAILSIYSFYFKEKFGREHYRVTHEQLYRINEFVVDTDLEFVAMYDRLYGNGLKRYEKVVRHHFNVIPITNNGNILSFIQTFRRYTEFEGVHEEAA